MKRTVILVTLLALGCIAVAAAAEEKTPAYTFKFSGYFKGDIVYDQARVNTGNYALYVLDKNENDLLGITARESRFGLDFTWKENDVQTDARFEFDFYGLGVSSASLSSQENKAAPMLRHAYAQVTKGRWSLLAGQTSDIISPLVPKTVNYTVCWDQGNIGYRRPQFRVSTWANVTERMKISAAAGVFRTIGGDLDDDKVDDGADAAIPTFEGRVALAAKPCEKRSLEIGLSGHYGREEYQFTPSGETRNIESWSGGADLKITLAKRLEVMGEFFMGENLGAYYGGVGQTVNPMKDEVGAKGGWGELSCGPVERLWINVGYGIDDPDDEDFVILYAPTDPPRSFIGKNSTIFANIMYDLTSTVTAMLELSQLSTTYLYKTYIDDQLMSGDKEFDDTRIQFALKAAIR